MKYRETTTLCAKGCGRNRRAGGRYCSRCHADAMRDSRRASSEEQVKRVVTKIVKTGIVKTGTVKPRSRMTAEMREKVARLAEQVAKQIEELNGGGGG
jgi:hypothetical protein